MTTPPDNSPLSGAGRILVENHLPAVLFIFGERNRQDYSNICVSDGGNRLGVKTLRGGCALTVERSSMPVK